MGGLGRHLAQLVEDARAGGELGQYHCFKWREGDNGAAGAIPRGVEQLLFRYTPLRWNLPQKNFLTNDLFDRAVAHRLPPPQDERDGLVCFAGQALRSFRRARELGWKRLELVAANSHANQVMRQHALARARWPIEPAWLNEKQRQKMLREYELADVIQVTSDYIWESFEREGVEREKLVKVGLRVDERFTPAPGATPPASRGGLEVVYVGSLTVAKGVPALLEAFEQFARQHDPRAQLTLVGGTQTRPMRRYLERWRGRIRLQIAPGDPLPHLRRAHVLVHPSFEDGFGYAPMEALACGVPVIVTDQTGMKEQVRPGVNGSIIPAGDVGQIIEALRHWQQETGRG